MELTAHNILQLKLQDIPELFSLKISRHERFSEIWIPEEQSNVYVFYLIEITQSPAPYSNFHTYLYRMYTPSRTIMRYDRWSGMSMLPDMSKFVSPEFAKLGDAYNQSMVKMAWQNDLRGIKRNLGDYVDFQMIKYKNRWKSQK